MIGDAATFWVVNASSCDWMAMWCSTCQQDVPAIASPEDHRVRCAKCRREITLGGRSENRPFEPDRIKPTAATSTAEPAKAESNSAAGDWPSAPFEFDEWELDELREARRAVRSLSSARTASPSEPIDITQNQPATPPTIHIERAKREGRRPPRKRRFAAVALAALVLGVMACAFGGSLLIWSWITDRGELWSLGLPFAIGGQAAMVFGLILQLDGLWQSNDQAVESLGELDKQLIELRRATSQISAGHGTPGQSFYFHLSEGCSPQILLADLKGQLDLLATRIADERRAA